MGVNIDRKRRNQKSPKRQPRQLVHEQHNNQVVESEYCGESGSCQTVKDVSSLRLPHFLTEDIEDRFYSISEVSQKYDMSHQYINSLVQRGLINPPKDGEYNNRTVYRLRKNDVLVIAYMSYLQIRGYRPSEITDQILNRGLYLQLLKTLLPANCDAFHKAFITFKDAIHNLPSLEEEQRKLLYYRAQEKSWNELQEAMSLSGSQLRKLLEETYKQIGLSFYNWTFAVKSASWFWDSRHKHSLEVHYLFQELEKIINPNGDCTISMFVQEVDPNTKIMSPWFVLKNRPVTKQAVKELQSSFRWGDKAQGISGLVATFNQMSDLPPNLKSLKVIYDKKFGIYIPDLHFVDDVLDEFFINLDREVARTKNDRNMWSFPLSFGNKCFIVSLTASKPDYFRNEHFDSIVGAVESMLMACGIDAENSLPIRLTKVSDAAKQFNKTPQYINTLIDKATIETEQAYDSCTNASIRHLTLKGMATLEIICEMQMQGYRTSEIDNYLQTYDYFQERSHSFLRKSNIIFLGNTGKIQELILQLPNLTEDHVAILGLRFNNQDWDTICEKLKMGSEEARRHLDNAYREIGRSLYNMIEVYSIRELIENG